MFQIMVVEDDTNTRRLMETVLKQHGYQPILACDGVEALADWLCAQIRMQKEKMKETRA